MKRILSLCLLLGCLLTVSLQAKECQVKDIPLVHLQDARRYVSNPDGILSPEAVAVMDTTLFALERQTGIQTLVVAVEQIEGGDCFDFAFRLGQENGVGQKVVTTDWSFCWSPANGAFSSRPVTDWKEACLMPSANASRNGT